MWLKERCRKIVCPNGEFYKGICLQALCPPGLVWRGKKCQEPGHLTTILEIENVLINEVRERAVYLEKEGTNVVLNHTTVDIPKTKSPKTEIPTQTQTLKLPIVPLAPKNTSVAPSNPATGCCKLRSPRICKLYGQKWICFNRSKVLCDARVCTAQIVYLQPPEVKYIPPILIMPPNNHTSGRDRGITSITLS